MSEWLRRQHDVDKEGHDELQARSHSAQLPVLTDS
jgi:hypothetical protein